jgi:hypothetical protein
VIGLVRSYSRCRGMGLCLRAWLRLRLLAASSNHELAGRIEGPFRVPSFRAAPRRDVMPRNAIMAQSRGASYRRKSLGLTPFYCG